MISYSAVHSQCDVGVRDAADAKRTAAAMSRTKRYGFPVPTYAIVSGGLDAPPLVIAAYDRGHRIGVTTDTLPDYLATQYPGIQVVP